MRDSRDELWRLISGFQVSQAIHAIAVLGIADLIAEQPQSDKELARRSGADPASLRRVLRALAAVGVLQESENGWYELTDVGSFLRNDVPGSHASMARLLSSGSCWAAWGNLLHTVRTGETAFEHTHGVDVWRYRAAHPESSLGFDQAMAASGEHYFNEVCAAFDFGRFRNILDVGGGDGAFLTKILQEHQASRGVLFDQPHVVAAAETRFAAADIATRCCAAGGDFFSAVPTGGDAYLLKWILHDWDDADCLRILHVCRASMARSARLLILEHVIGEANTAAEGKLMDMMMMVITGGRERTRSEFASLLDAAGFDIVSVTATRSMLSIVEAAPKHARSPNRAL